MADFEVSCPHCKQSLDCPEELGGKSVECPACNGVILIATPPPLAKALILPPRLFQPISPIITPRKSNACTPSTYFKGGRFGTICYILVGVFIIIFGIVCVVSYMYSTDRAEQKNEKLLIIEANTKVQSLVLKATQDVNIGDIDAAKRSLQLALGVLNANDLTGVKQLMQQIDSATNPVCIRSALMKLPDDTLQKLRNGGPMPREFAFGYKKLNSYAAVIVKEQLEDFAAAPEKWQNERFERAEADRKSIEYRQIPSKASILLASYVVVLNNSNVTLVNDVSVKQNGGYWTATVMVNNFWHFRHYQIRLQDAQELWKAWAKIASPQNHGDAKIRLVDLHGNEVGGSNVWGGIWVKE